MRSSFNSGRLTLDWMQYWSQTAYGDEDRYLYRESSAENIYNGLYLIASDFKAIAEINSNPDTAGSALSVSGIEFFIDGEKTLLNNYKDVQ